MSSTEHLFPPSLLASLTENSSDPKAFSLPENYSIRPLQAVDSESGLLDVLRVLTTVGNISAERFDQRFSYMQAVNAVGKMNDGGPSSDNPGAGGTYYIIVVCNGEGKIVGTGAVIVERKFIHELGLVGHIEDIAVAKDQQGKKLGLRIIQALDHVAEKVGCYKTILDCSEANEGFYVKCGYKRAGLEMAHYY